MKKVFLWIRWGVYLALWILGLLYGINLYSDILYGFTSFLRDTLKMEKIISNDFFFFLLFPGIFLVLFCGLFFFTYRVELPTYKAPFYSFSTFLPRLVKSCVVLLVCCLVLEGYLFFFSFFNAPRYIVHFSPYSLGWIKIVIPWYYFSQEIAFLVAYLRTVEENERDSEDSLKQTSDNCDA